MKLRNCLLIIVVGLIVVNLFAGDVTQFSGTWNLDESRLADTAQGPRMGPNKIVVEQEDNSLKTEKFMSNPMMGDFTVSEVVTLDGKESKNSLEFGEKTSTVQWSEDGKVLTITSTMIMNWDGQDMEMNTVEKWSLEKKDVLKIDSKFSSQMGEMENTVYFNKSK